MAIPAHLDTNVFGHAHRLDDGVSQDHVKKLRDAVKAGVLTIPASIYVAQELLEAKETSPALGRLYLDVVSMDVQVKAPKQLIAEAVLAYARHADEPTPCVPLKEEERSVWRKALGPQPGETPWEVSPTPHVDDFLAFMRNAQGQGKETIRVNAQKHHRVRPFEDLWPELSHFYAVGLAEQAGALAGCKERGIAGLLENRSILAATGMTVRLIYAQGAGGEKPERGDARDLQHAVMAAALGGPFVTHARGSPGA